MTFEPLEEIYGHRFSERETDAVRAVWRVLVRDFFQKLIPSDAAVLDVGCGFCHFLNAVRAGERVGIDANPAVLRSADPGVTIYVAADLSLEVLGERRFDVIFLSNVLEHLDSGAAVIALLRRCASRLRTGGRLIILQPNFRLVGPRYFDFIDHKTILTDASVREALAIAGMRLTRQIVRFLPYTTKSKLPSHPLLVRIYLRLPVLWPLFGRQSLFEAERP